VFRPLLISLLVVAVLGAAAGHAGSIASPPTRVTVIGDSIPTAMAYNAPAKRVLERGVDLDLQLAVCRRLVGESCPYEGSRPPSLVDLLPSLQLGSTVVVAVGYNDWENTFADAVETALQALQKEGVDHVLWLTLRAERQSYLSMNEVIRSAAGRHPELTIVDWNAYSRNNPDWFQDDGLHLTGDGAFAMATLVHRSLDELGLVAAPAQNKLAITARALPAARVGQPYFVRLTASGGTRPITWKLKSGTLPLGVRLLRDGRIKGKPKVAGRSTATVLATDAKGLAASRRLEIAVRAR
jgi:hypothetical protein